MARNLGHCGECHTPRNGLGIPDHSREFAGAELGDEIIEPIDADALIEWTANNFDIFLLLGLKPDGEFVGGDMNEVIEHNTSKLTDEDRMRLLPSLRDIILQAAKRTQVKKYLKFSEVRAASESRPVSIDS